MPAQSLERVECAGNKAASHALVYLHGVDPPEPTQQESSNRELLKRLANSEGIALALLRSTHFCTQAAFKGKLCWPRGDDQSMLADLRHMLKDAAVCHKPSAKIGMLGFSNGGYFINKIVSRCLKTPVFWLASIGSAGSVDSPGMNQSACGHLHLMIGRKDISQTKARKFYQELRKVGRSVELVEFEGGHIVPEGPTRDAIRSWKNSRP